MTSIEPVALHCLGKTWQFGHRPENLTAHLCRCHSCPEWSRQREDHKWLRLTDSCLILGSQAAHPKARTPHTSCGVDNFPDALSGGHDADVRCGHVLVCMHVCVMSVGCQTQLLKGISQIAMPAVKARNIIDCELDTSCSGQRPTACPTSTLRCLTARGTVRWVAWWFNGGCCMTMSS